MQTGPDVDVRELLDGERDAIHPPITEQAPICAEYQANTTCEIPLFELTLSGVGQLRPGLPGLPCGPALSPGMELPVGGEGVRTVVGAAEFPPLTVWLGPPDWLAVVGALPAVGAVLVVGASLAGAWVAVDGSELTDGGEVTEDVLAGVEVLELDSAPWSLLLQPDSRAIEAAADDRANRPTRPRR